MGLRPVLPGGLRHAGDHALVRDLAKADPAQAELAVVGACAPAPAAPMVVACLVPASALLADDLRCLCHVLLTRSLSGLRLAPAPRRRPRAPAVARVPARARAPAAAPAARPAAAPLRACLAGRACRANAAARTPPRRSRPWW